MESHNPRSSQPTPRLEIIIQPQSKFRFRYKSEMKGKHGSLLGQPLVSGGSQGLMDLSRTSPTGNKIDKSIFPTVKLENFTGEAIIRCSLVCDTEPHYPHPHLLEMSPPLTTTSRSPSPKLSTFDPEENEPLKPEEDSGAHEDSKQIIELPVSFENNYTAAFQGLNIIYTGRKSMRKVLTRKMSLLAESDPRKSSPDSLCLSSTLNLNVVLLYFEAFTRDPNSEDPALIPICPGIVSTSIQHNKSTQTGDLRIVRIDKHISCCTGEEEVFILCEKVDKHNIQIKFFQENDKGIEIWKAYGKFSKLDVHHQYAIVFKTPPYSSINIDEDIDVWLQLERPSDGATSQPIKFKYKPIERIRKMPKVLKSRTGNEPGPSPMNGSERRDDGEQRGSSGGGGTFEINGPQDQGSTSVPGVRQGTNLSPTTDLINVPSSIRNNSNELAIRVALSVGQGLYHWAATSDIDFLLRKLGHLLCLVNENGDNALHTSIQNRQREPFLRILKMARTTPGIASIINEPNVSRMTPLSLATAGNDPECQYFVSELLKHGADVTAENNDGDTPIHIAVKMGNLTALRVLLTSPCAYAALNRYNYSSFTPIHLAAFSGNLEALELICSCTYFPRTKIDFKLAELTYGRTPLHLTVENGDLLSTHLILKSCFETTELVNCQNYRGDSPLHLAVSSGYTAIAALLLYYGADPSIENFIRKSEDFDESEDSDGGGYTPFDLAPNKNVKNILEGSKEEWERIAKGCSCLLDEMITISPGKAPTRDVKKFSIDSIHFDSGIDIKEQITA